MNQPNPFITVPPPPNPCVEFLRNALKEAEAGRIVGVGAVFVLGPGVIDAATAGALSADMYFGLEMVKDTVKQGILNPKKVVPILGGGIPGLR